MEWCAAGMAYARLSTKNGSILPISTATKVLVHDGWVYKSIRSTDFVVAWTVITDHCPLDPTYLPMDY